MLNAFISNPCGPTLSKVLDCGFHKTKGENAKYRYEEKTTRGKKTSHKVNSRASEPLCAVSLALNSPVTIERHATRLRYFFTKIGLSGNNNNNRIIIEALCTRLMKIIHTVLNLGGASFYCGQLMQPVMIALLKFVPLTSASISVALEVSMVWSAFESLTSKRVALERSTHGLSVRVPIPGQERSALSR